LDGYDEPILVVGRSEGARDRYALFISYFSHVREGIFVTMATILKGEKNKFRLNETLFV
jgi:hypothetical protein